MTTLHLMKKQLFIASAMYLAASATAPATDIIVLTDVHVTPGNACEQKLIEAVNEINATPGIGAVVLSGDLTNEGSDEQLSNVKRIVDKIRYPFYIIPGNHEDTWSQSATKTFFDLWGNDRFVGEADDLILIGTNCGPYMKMGDGHVKQEDLHWLNSTLAERVKDGKRVVSINHYPLQPEMDNYTDYIRVLEKYPTITHLNGHFHKYDHYMSGNIPSMMLGALDRGKGVYGYSLVRIDSDSIHVYSKNLGKEPELMQSYAVSTEITPARFPERRQLTQPEGFSITKIWTDSASIFTRLGIDDRNIYFGNSLGVAKAVDKKNGKLKWEVPTGASMFSRPVPAGKKVYIPTAVKKLMVADAGKGKIIEEYPSDGPYMADGTVADGMLYQGSFRKMECRDAKSGKLKWTYDSIFNYCQAAPAIDGNDIVFGAWDTNLRCLDKNTGRLRWVWNNGNKANLLGPGNVVPVITDDKVITVAPDRYMTAIDRRTGRQLWRNKDHKYRESLGCNPSRTVAYAKTMDGELVAVDITGNDFKELWTVDMGIGYEHAPCLVAERDGVVYAGSRQGILTAVDPASRKVLWNANLGVSEINGIDVDPATGDIYVSLIEGTVYRVHKTK